MSHYIKDPKRDHSFDNHPHLHLLVFKVHKGDLQQRGLPRTRPNRYYSCSDPFVAEPFCKDEAQRILQLFRPLCCRTLLGSLDFWIKGSDTPPSLKLCVAVATRMAALLQLLLRHSETKSFA